MTVDINGQTVFARTDKGAEEIEQRTYRLPIRLRTLLLLVNGSDPVGRILEKAAGIGNGIQMFDELLAQGFIRETRNSVRTTAPAAKTAPRADAGFRDVMRTISMWIHDMLGPDGDQITVKLESSRSLSELRQFLQSHRELLEMAAGKQRSEEFFQRVSLALEKNHSTSVS